MTTPTAAEIAARADRAAETAAAWYAEAGQHYPTDEQLADAIAQHAADCKRERQDKRNARARADRAARRAKDARNV